MNYYISNLEVSPYIQHFGVLGMHWGVRRYQNADGSLTAAGKKRYAAEEKVTNKIKKTHNKSTGAKVGNYLVNGLYAPAYSVYRSQGKSKIESWGRTQLTGVVFSAAASATVGLGAMAIARMTGTTFTPNHRGRAAGALAMGAATSALTYYNAKKLAIDKEMKKSK